MAKVAKPASSGLKIRRFLKEGVRVRPPSQAPRSLSEPRQCQRLHVACGEMATPVEWAAAIEPINDEPCSPRRDEELAAQG